jgi:bifunctional non-homologous end joining protein LigD
MAAESALPNKGERHYRCAACGMMVNPDHEGERLYHSWPGHHPIPLDLRFVEPMLATDADSPPQGDGWLHEREYHGERVQMVIEGESITILDRQGEKIDDRFGAFAEPAREIECFSAIIDGIILGEERLVALDLLHLNGRDLRDESLVDRRARLRRLIRPLPKAGLISMADEVLAGASSNLPRRIVSKRVDSRYSSGPSNDWLKWDRAD